MDTTSALLDLAICVAYVSIPLQLVFVATRKVTAIDFRKITGNMSSDELAISRTLIIAFACFILCCGCGHGIRARKALSNTSEDFLSRMEHTIHVGTALVSVLTSLLLGMWLPKLLSFCNDIEIHRKGYMKIVMEEYAKEDQIVTSGDLEEMKGSERELRGKVASLEAQLKRTAHELLIAQDFSVDVISLEETAGGILQKSKDLSQELKPLPNLLGKCQGHRKVLSTSQMKQIIGAIYVLNKARPSWAENPDGTWGDFHILLRRIVGQKSAKYATLPSESWLEVCNWCASLSHQQLISLLQSVLNFANSPKPEKVVEIADQLKLINAAA
ncbi:unnamed protein product [Cladocopium goreaui]|uniref:Protein kinase domain-containing protein n=1 Tax=Cladocopium goreaui TaxID=2562237 RepID=A0A9P1CLM7_9DINO|nr:unnamed protein product [Cladocopium goreaui]